MIGYAPSCQAFIGARFAPLRPGGCWNWYLKPSRYRDVVFLGSNSVVRIETKASRLLSHHPQSPVGPWSTGKTYPEGREHIHALVPPQLETASLLYNRRRS